MRDYDLTHSIGDPRSHSTYGEPTRPPMDQERSLGMQPLPTPPLVTAQPMLATHGILPTPQPQNFPHFSCTILMRPPSILTPPLPLASTGLWLSVQPPSTFMLPSAFPGGGVQMNRVQIDQDEQVQGTSQSLQVEENQPSRTVPRLVR